MDTSYVQYFLCVNPLFVESLFGKLNIHTQVVELLISLFSNSMSTLNPLVIDIEIFFLA
jgi:hypothetical protein